MDREERAVSSGKSSLSDRHDKYAPYWAAALLILCLTGISTIWIDLGIFWKGYVLDMTGPAWNYILFRGLNTGYADNVWTRFFKPKSTVIIFTSVCILIETLQYFKVYDSTFDPWDFLAYASLLFPVYIIDSFSSFKQY
ncbi:MAG: hypothetical protein K9I69_05140 [Ignavibacteriales bacterium]|nr:hypothetical protein [Ignavibacteriales bacterium]MCF8306142.1 hypothetical protein [Ignavibacteriales bacterium]MCF8315804.1 hypothetical protein [Ignavibacteriales bacterium]MCF8437264.1 hypothetical protein [Ignavibacteriales bacterium]